MACSNLIKKTNDSLLYIKKSSNHPPQIIKQLPKIISDRFSKHSINEEVFNESKGEYENPLKQSGYNNINLKFQPLITSNTIQKRRRNISSYGLIHHSAVVSPLMFWFHYLMYFFWCIVFDIYFCYFYSIVQRIYLIIAYCKYDDETLVVYKCLFFKQLIFAPKVEHKHIHIYTYIYIYIYIYTYMYIYIYMYYIYHIVRLPFNKVSNSEACLSIPELGFYWGVLLFE